VRKREDRREKREGERIRKAEGSPREGIYAHKCTREV